jgi:hypothetical protein
MGSKKTETPYITVEEQTWWINIRKSTLAFELVIRKVQAN